MKDQVNQFYNSFENVDKFDSGELTELFLYFLIEEYGLEAAAIKDIKDCFLLCDLNAPAGLSARLSEGARKSPAKFIKLEQGYRLQRHVKDRIAKRRSGYASNAAAIQVATDLRIELSKITNVDTKAFAQEALECYESKLWRSAVVMSWIGAVHLLYDHVIKHKLADFNAEAVRINPRFRAVNNIDELAKSMGEGDFLDRLENISVLSNSDKKELKECLVRRNSCGHPNSYQPRQNTVAHHLEVLLVNVYQRFN